MNKTLRKAMISTIAMLVVAVMSLTGVTYAWFTAAGDASVTGINATVASVDGGVLISTGSDVWASNIALGETPTFIPVSSAGALADDNDDPGVKAMKFFSATVSDTNSANITTTSATTGFFKTTLYLKNITGADLTVDLTGTEILDTSKNAHYAARLAIVVEDRSTTSFELAKDGLAESEGVASETQFERDVKIYEPYAKDHTRGAQNLYGALETEESPRAYKAVNKEATNFPWAAESNEALTDMNGKVKYNANEMTISVADTEIVKVSIYVWLEGQDIDCENTIAADTMKVNLFFTKQENAQG